VQVAGHGSRKPPSPLPSDRTNNRARDVLRDGEATRGRMRRRSVAGERWAGAESGGAAVGVGKEEGEGIEETHRERARFQ
jgi:hypothetical protein